MCVDDEFSKPFKSYLGGYNFINSMVKEKWCDEKHFNKELVMTKKDIVDFQNSNEC